MLPPPAHPKPPPPSHPHPYPNSPPSYELLAAPPPGQSGHVPGRPHGAGPRAEEELLGEQVGVLLLLALLVEQGDAGGRAHHVRVQREVVADSDAVDVVAAAVAVAVAVAVRPARRGCLLQAPVVGVVLRLCREDVSVVEAGRAVVVVVVAVGGGVVVVVVVGGGGGGGVVGGFR